MWVIPALTPEFIKRMERILELYAKPFNPDQPVLCFDETSKQLLEDTRSVLPAQEGRPRHRDYEYRRNGTRNIFLAVEPKGGWREATVTERRTKEDFAREIRHIAGLPRYREAKRIHLVLDNLNTHGPESLIATLGTRTAHRVLERVRFHHTPIHASWLNMAEIELSILSRQALGGRIPDGTALRGRVARWQEKRNRAGAGIQWKFTKEHAQKIFKYGVGKLS